MDGISRILELLPTTQEIQMKDSFFDIIGRGHDEDLISRMLKYLFENKMEIVNGLLKKHNFELLKEITSIECEKTIDNGQCIDLFIEGISQKDDKVIIVIENKVYSWEHDDQCKAYYEDTDHKYPKAQRIYFYLKPSYNLSYPNCSNFKIITYDDIYNILFQMDKRTRYEEDFMATIKNNLMENIMEEIDYEILNNYSKLQKRINQNIKLMENFNKNLASILEEKLNLICEESDNHRTYRFYKSEHKKDNDYYFYIEFKYENNDFSTVYFQYTIRRFETTGNSLISKFVKSKGRTFSVSGLWCVLERATLKMKSNNVLSTEWKKELEDFSIKYLTDFSNKLENLFEEFINYKKAH